MSKGPSVNIYEALLNSIEELAKVEDTMRNGEVALVSLSQFVSSKEPEISKFTKVLSELCRHFEDYDFQSGFQFDDISSKLLSLSNLRERLVKMGEEARTLSSYPDFYGSAKAIETCKGLVLACREKLSLNEIDSVSKVVEANIEKLSSIRKQFENDNYILAKIKDAIDKESEILSKYKTAFFEIQRYVDGFPHQGQDNLAEIEKYIKSVLQINTLISSIGTQISLIEPFCDRHNKNSVVSGYTNMVKEAYEKLNYDSSEKFKRAFDGILKNAQEVLSAFEQERIELIQIQSKLENCTPEIWKEDNEKLLSAIETLLDGDTAKTQMDVECIKKNINNAKDNRKKNIRDMTNEYPWLNSEKYKDFHNRLISRYITYAEYKSAIDSVRGERNKKILKGVGIGVAIVAAIGIICAYWKIILGIIVVVLVGGTLMLFSKSDD